MELEPKNLIVDRQRMRHLHTGAVTDGVAVPDCVNHDVMIKSDARRARFRYLDGLRWFLGR